MIIHSTHVFAEFNRMTVHVTIFMTAFIVEDTLIMNKCDDDECTEYGIIIDAVMTNVIDNEIPGLELKEIIYI